MDVGEMQRKLSGWAAQDKTLRFYDLYHLLYDRDWLRLAHDAVAQSAGSATAGCDGITMGRFDTFAKLWTLCQPCHKSKIQSDRRAESPVP